MEVCTATTSIAVKDRNSPPTSPTSSSLSLLAYPRTCTEFAMNASTWFRRKRVRTWMHLIFIWTWSFEIVSVCNSDKRWNYIYNVGIEVNIYLVGMFSVGAVVHRHHHRIEHFRCEKRATGWSGERFYMYSSHSKQLKFVRHRQYNQRVDRKRDIFMFLLQKRFVLIATRAYRKVTI